MPETKPRVFVTGAAGRIGSYFAEHSADRYDFKLMVQNDEQAEKVREFGEVLVAQLGDRDRLEELMRGCDVLVHLAANPSPKAKWDSVLNDNIIGTYHALDAAACAGVKRVIYASSIHAISSYPPGRQVRPEDAGRPGDLYGVSKCFGEAMASYLAMQHDISAIAVRIGSFQPVEAAKDPKRVHMVNSFVSRRDLNHLLQQCVEAPEHIRLAVAHGVSHNRFNRMDLSQTIDLLDYRPQDDFTEINPAMKDLHLRDRVTPHAHRYRG